MKVTVKTRVLIQSRLKADNPDPVYNVQKITYEDVKEFKYSYYSGLTIETEERGHSWKHVIAWHDVEEFEVK